MRSPILRAELGDVEAAVLIGRKVRPSDASVVRYRQVREPDIAEFRDASRARSDHQIAQAEFSERENADLRMPDLEDVWSRQTGLTLEDLAEVGKGLEFKGKGLAKGVKTWSKEQFAGAVRGYWNISKGLLLHGRPPAVWMNLSDRAVRRPLLGRAVGNPQVLMNYHPVSRGPWRIKAVLDSEGHPVGANFLVVRPRSPDTPIELLWALCNSPYANAYAYTHASKREITAGVMRRMPVPRCEKGDMEAVVRSVQAYVKAAEELDAAALRSPQAENRCHDRLLEIDALVLRLYDLPAGAERQVLEVFRETSPARAGVSFPWPPYYPDDFGAQVPLYVYTSVAKRATRTKAPRSRSRARSGEATASDGGDIELPETVAETASFPVPKEVLEELGMLYDELAGLDDLRAQLGSTPELEARAAGRRAELRRIQEDQARRIAAAFRERFLMPPLEGPDLIDRVDRILESYGDPSGPHRAVFPADDEKT